MNLSLLFACALLGCGTVEPLHRPPTRTEMGRVNEAGGSITVELLVPTSGRIDRVVSANSAEIVVAPKEGRPYALRLGDVTGFSGRDRTRGAAIGGAVGAGFGIVSLLSLALAHGDIGDGAGSRSSPCSNCGGTSAPRVVVALLAEGAVFGGIGALIGSVVGTRVTFPLELGPPAALPPDPPTPTDTPSTSVSNTSASVVAFLAEVRATPSNVASVIEILARGERLFVDETPRAGWRVATLADGRVGYIQDAQVKLDAK